jgi:predicted lipase
MHRKFMTGTVHCGFCEAYGHVEAQIRKTIADLYFQMPRQIYITGHSLGGALANIAALDLTNYMSDLAEKYPSAPFDRFKVTGLYTFGAPRVFDANGASFMDEKVKQHFRFVFGNDLVVKVPFQVQGFTHSGNGFYFKRDNCEITTDKNLKKSWSETFFGPLHRFVGLFNRYAFKDHGLANYRKCFIEGFRP